MSKNNLLEGITNYDIVLVKYLHHYGGDELGPKRTAEVTRTGFVVNKGECGLQLSAYDARLTEKLPDLFRPSDIRQWILLENLVSISKLSVIK